MDQQFNDWNYIWNIKIKKINGEDQTYWRSIFEGPNGKTLKLKD